MSVGKPYPPEVTMFIRDNYIGTGHQAMVDRLLAELGVTYTVKQIRAYYKNHGLKCGLTGHFPKGHIPANKGKHTGGGPKETLFQRGHMPHNHLPVRSEIVSADGYVRIKLAEPKVWTEKHRHIWEAANGPIPPGHIVIFANGDRMDVRLDNLLLVTRAQLVRMNQNRLIYRDGGLTHTGALIADVLNAVGKKRRKKRDR